MKRLFFFLIVLNLSALTAQESKQEIKTFTKNILLNEQFSNEEYEKTIHFNNYFKKGTPDYDNYFNWVKLSITEIKKRIVNNENLIICNYNELPSDIKEKISLKQKNQYTVFFLVEKTKSKTHLITHFIFDKNNNIISFFNKLSKKEEVFNPWYLNEKMVLEN